MTFINPQGENAIDFPCSYCWRAYYEETFYRRYLPSIEPPAEEQPKAEEYVVEHRIIKTHDKQLTQKANELEGAIKYLLEKQKKPRQGSYFLKK